LKLYVIARDVSDNEIKRASQSIIFILTCIFKHADLLGHPFAAAVVTKIKKSVGSIDP
jgi:hypothetical protein